MGVGSGVDWGWDGVVDAPMWWGIGYLGGEDDDGVIIIISGEQVWVWVHTWMC